MILAKHFLHAPGSAILHGCGDVPASVEDMQQALAYSPRMWRCSYNNRPHSF